MRTPAAEEKKQRVYEYIKGYINEHGYSPSHLLLFLILSEPHSGCKFDQFQHLGISEFFNK